MAISPANPLSMKSVKSLLITLLIGLVLLFASGCTQPSVEDGSQKQITSNPALPASDITFFLQIPDHIPDDLPIHFILLDEVSGLPYNQKTYRMQRMEAFRYGVTIRLAHQAVIKYRYAAGEQMEHPEFTAMGEPVRYRMYFVDGPGFSDDKVAGWDSAAISSPKGRIMGGAIERETGTPIPDLMVSSSGVTGFTASDGSFRLEGVPTGNHPIVFYSMDGKFHTFQQNANTAADASTPVQAELTPTKMVEVTFKLRVPENTVPTVPVKLAGNLVQLGNTFGELGGGLSIPGDGLPTLEPSGSGLYAITLKLPAGIMIEYKYTMGDGFWNAEHHLDGRYVVRQMVVPTDQDHWVVEDEVPTWQSSNAPPIWFDLVAGGGLKEGEHIYIQFKLVDWMEPLPMWIGGEGRWGYKLNSPTNFSASLPYRFCRNGQCGGDAGAAVDLYDESHSVPPNRDSSSSLVTLVEDWKWNFDGNFQTVIPSIEVITRPEGFMLGVEMAEYFNPSRTDPVHLQLADLAAVNANTIVLSPTWKAKHQIPPIFDLEPGLDGFLQDQIAISQTTGSLGIGISLAPKIDLPVSSVEWWATAPRDFSWWQVWFEQYRRFILHHAEAAQQMNAHTLILDGEWLAPAFPDGVIFDGSTSNVPPDASDRWAIIIGEIRAVYSGKIFISLDLEHDLEPPKDLLELADGIFFRLSAGIGNGVDTPMEVMAANAGILLDEVALPLSMENDLSIIIALAYPSADGAASGCIESPTGSCIPSQMLSPFELDFELVPLDLAEQAETYHAVLMAINARDWIDGVITSGYFPPLGLLDKSLSVHGKPSQDVLWFWFKGFLGLE